MARHLKTGKTPDQRSTDAKKVHDIVSAILEDLEARGETALREISEKFDHWNPPSFRLSEQEIDHCLSQLSRQNLDDIKFAQTQVRNFAQAQRSSIMDIEVETLPGVILGHKNIPVESVGCYIPGGKYPLVASAHMSVVTAKVAGVGRVIASAPPFHGKPSPAVVAAMHLGGADEIYCMGGVQAIAAMALGTKNIDPVAMVVGAGNAYVAEAKRQVFGQVGIDSIAGPSEVLILADENNNPEHIAIDLLAQAEHDEDAQSILITDSGTLAAAVAGAVDAILPTLPRARIATASWVNNGAIILVRNWDEAVDLANRIAPEHLQLMLAEPDKLFDQIRHAGAIFLGRSTPEAIGDYVAGPNHVLPTSGTARFASGLSVYDFMKRTTYLSVPPRALKVIGPAAVTLAEAEGLTAHARSVSARLAKP